MENTILKRDVYVEDSVWYYKPNNIAPPIFAVLFFFSGCVHAWQTYRYKSWKMTTFVPWGAFLMTCGFAVREAGSYYYKDLGILIASIVLLFSGPPVYAAADYFILGRTLYYIPWLSPMAPGRVTQTFVVLDILIEILVGNGASKMANTSISHPERQAGEIMVKIALMLQAVMFGAYITLLGVWHTRVRRAGLLSNNLRNVVWALYTSASLISIRCIYRIVEFFEGYTGELYTHEAYFYVFEATLMLLNSVVLNIFHPGKYFPQTSEMYLSPDGVTEVKGPGWRDLRPWYVAIVDPFNLTGLLRKDLAKEHFWETQQASDAEEVAEVSKEGHKREN